MAEKVVDQNIRRESIASQPKRRFENVCSYFMFATNIGLLGYLAFGWLGVVPGICIGCFWARIRRGYLLKVELQEIEEIRSLNDQNLDDEKARPGEEIQQPRLNRNLFFFKSVSLAEQFIQGTLCFLLLWVFGLHFSTASAETNLVTRFLEYIFKTISSAYSPDLELGVGGQPFKVVLAYGILLSAQYILKCIYLLFSETANFKKLILHFINKKEIIILMFSIIFVFLFLALYLVVLIRLPEVISSDPELLRTFFVFSGVLFLQPFLFFTLLGMIATAAVLATRPRGG